MTFSDWEKTSNLYAEWQERGRREFMDFEIVALCESAYKAGTRDAVASVQKAAIVARGLDKQKA